jgi:imidazolonepropionase
MSRYCSFCGGRDGDVGHLITGPRGVAICNECVKLAHQFGGTVALASTTEFLLTGISRLVTNDPRHGGITGTIGNAALVVRGGHVTWVGKEDDLPSAYRRFHTASCEGRAVIPGFVDSHTHLIFAGNRAGEFASRLTGRSYTQIAAGGGGIKATVAATRRAPVSQLIIEAGDRVSAMVAAGTTTVEIKSGYGLDVDNEVKLLEVASQIGANHPVDVVPTFLGAHAVPVEFDGRRTDYVDLVCNEMIPRCAPLARFCDVFCDQGAFTVEESRRILEVGRRHGLAPRLHANQLADSGGVELAIELGAVTADHLEHLDDRQIEALAGSGTVAVLMPTASLSLRTPHAPAARLWEAGATVALATDCNPGTSYVESMQLVVALACLEMGLTVDQALWSATRGGALALLEKDKGWLGPGSAADLLVIDADGPEHFPYRPGSNLVWKVWKGGDLTVGGLA